jgi:Uma2 family endonuclease
LPLTEWQRKIGVVAVVDAAIYSGPNTPGPKRWSVDEYEQLDEMGLLSREGEHYELIDGEIVSKLGQNNPHIAGITLASEALRAAFGAGFIVSQQRPIALGQSDEPEPDVSVIRGGVRDFDHRMPTPSEIALLVEVVDSRPDTARGAKVSMYARHGIAEYWILDVRSRSLEVRRGPRPEFGDWREITIYTETDPVTPLAVPTSVIAIADLLPTLVAE